MVHFVRFRLSLLYAIAQNIINIHLFFGNFLGAATIQERPLLARAR